MGGKVERREEGEAGVGRERDVFQTKFSSMMILCVW